MKIKTRNCVHETNSSSQHSIVVMKSNETFGLDEIKESCYISKDGTLNLYEHKMEYGRSPFKCLDTFYDKWLYCVCSLCKEYGDEMWDKLEGIIKKYTGAKIVCPPISSQPTSLSDDAICNILKNLERTLHEHGIERELSYWESNSGWKHYDEPHTGYAEDYGMLKSFLDRECIDVEDFIIHKRYIIIVDGDEYCIWDSMKRSGLVNKECIAEEYPRYEN